MFAFILSASYFIPARLNVRNHPNELTCRRSVSSNWRAWSLFASLIGSNDRSNGKWKLRCWRHRVTRRSINIDQHPMFVTKTTAVRLHPGMCLRAQRSDAIMRMFERILSGANVAKALLSNSDRISFGEDYAKRNESALRSGK